MLWVPPGFAHGFYTISECVEVIYKTTDYYAPEYERSIIWNDPDIEIQWPELTKEKLILSPKDEQGLTLKEAEVFA
jgi:dTDP-4-dehydrorhamnose 3,5-epimerase